MTQALEHRFSATPSAGEVTGILLRPPNAWALFVFAHGAGADLRHSFLSGIADRLAGVGVASFRYNFPYMEKGRGGPNPAPVLAGTVRSAVAEATRLAPDLPLFAGGKSMGGRMTSTAAASEPLPRVVGLAFFGFPLHAPGKESAERGAHLADVRLPMLFLQGNRDKLADLTLLDPLLRSMDTAPRLHVIDGADHSFNVPKRSGRSSDDVWDELSSVFVDWAASLVPARSH